MSNWLAGAAQDFADGRPRVVAAGTREVVLLQADGAYHAFENVCQHMGGPIGEGEIITRGGVQYLVCPVHGWRYDLATGVCTVDPSVKLKEFPVVEDEGSVYVVA